MLTRKAQDAAITQIIDYLRLVDNHFHPPVYALMLEHGRRYYMGRQTFAGPRRTRGQCYMNAFKAANADRGLIYVEGWCHMGLIPIEHAWCIDRRGRVVDPTLPEASGYFGIPFQWTYVQRTALRTGVYGIISNIGIEEMCKHDTAQTQDS
jgi:hypothetical protein